VELRYPAPDHFNTAVTINYVGSGSHRTNVGGLYNTSLKPGQECLRAQSISLHNPDLLGSQRGCIELQRLQAEVNRRLTSGFLLSDFLHILKSPLDG